MAVGLFLVSSGFHQQADDLRMAMPRRCKHWSGLDPSRMAKNIILCSLYTGSYRGIILGSWKRRWKLLYCGHIGLYRGYIGIMEKKMEATIWKVVLFQ